MNIERLLRIKAAILAEPKKFEMRYFFVRDEESPCGTAACIAGFAIADRLKADTLAGARTLAEASDFDYWEQGQLSLGLDWNQARRLFDEHHWPEQFAYRGDTAESRAQAAAERIDYFILTNGTDIVPAEQKA
jgi:hypothetical protein